MTDTRITKRTLPDGGVVSLLSVLGDAGITNNYTYQIWSVVSASADHPSGTVVEGRDDAAETVFRTFYMPDGVLHAPDRADLIDPDYPYLRATADAALCHLVYIHLAGLFGRLPWELELDDLDRPRVGRIARAMGIEKQVSDYLGSVLDLNREQDVAPGLGG